MSETRLPNHNSSIRNYNLSRMAGCIAASKKVDTEAYMISQGEEKQQNALYNIKKDVFMYYKRACGSCAVASCVYRLNASTNMLAKTLREDTTTSDRYRDRVKLKTDYGTYENGDISCERLMEQPRIKKQERFEARQNIYTQKLMGEVEDMVEARVEQEPEPAEIVLHVQDYTEVEGDQTTMFKEEAVQITMNDIIKNS